MPAPVSEIDAPTLKTLLDQGKAAVIDVREVEEHAREKIKGSRLVPLSHFNPADVPMDNGQRIVLQCQSGTRAAQAAAHLVASGRAEATVLKGGLKAWKAAGLPVELNAKVPISIMRQVQLVVGPLILVGTLLAWLVSPWFWIVPAFFGAGLTFAGASGFCGMGAMLGKMPWNRAATKKSCC